MAPTPLAVVHGLEIAAGAGALVLVLMLWSLAVGAPFRPFLALRYLRSRPIHLIGALGIAVAVWALVLVVSIFDGYIVEMRRHIRGTASDLSLVYVDPSQPFAGLAEVLHANPDVRSVAPRSQQRADHASLPTAPPTSSLSWTERGMSPLVPASLQGPAVGLTPYAYPHSSAACAPFAMPPLLFAGAEWPRFQEL
jgi:hypothetical protein